VACVYVCLLNGSDPVPRSALQGKAVRFKNVLQLGLHSPRTVTAVVSRKALYLADAHDGKKLYATYDRLPIAALCAH